MPVSGEDILRRAIAPPGMEDNPMKLGGKGTSEVAIAARYKAFVHAFIANGRNATQAAITAGYSEKSATAAGSKLLNSPVIKLLIEQFEARLAERTAITTERVLQEIGRVAFADIRKIYHPDGRLKLPHELDDDGAAIVSAMKSLESTDDDGVVTTMKDVRLWDKMSALEKAAKILGMFEKDNSQRADNVTVNVIGVSVPRA